MPYLTVKYATQMQGSGGAAASTGAEAEGCVKRLCAPGVLHDAVQGDALRRVGRQHRPQQLQALLRCEQKGDLGFKAFSFGCSVP